MTKRISLIAIVAIGMGELFLAGDTGNPHVPIHPLPPTPPTCYRCGNREDNSMSPPFEATLACIARAREFSIVFIYIQLFALLLPI